MNGKVLDFRLYNDGNAQYDEYQTYSSPSGALQADAIKNLHQVKLQEAELKEISDLLDENEFLKIEAIISQKKICKDAFINTEMKTVINNSSKQILIKNHCAILSDAKSSESYFEKFPSKLNRLFEIIRKLKDKDSAGKFYN